MRLPWGMSKKAIPPKDWREGRLVHAWELHEQEEHVLRHQPGPGATPKLSPEQQAKLPAFLPTGPTQECLLS